MPPPQGKEIIVAHADIAILDENLAAAYIAGIGIVAGIDGIGQRGLARMVTPRNRDVVESGR